MTTYYERAFESHCVCVSVCVGRLQVRYNKSTARPHELDCDKTDG